eukprot:4080177-Amphidinium_carterae.2
MPSEFTGGVMRLRCVTSGLTGSCQVAWSEGGSQPGVNSPPKTKSRWCVQGFRDPAEGNFTPIPLRPQ